MRIYGEVLQGRSVCCFKTLTNAIFKPKGLVKTLFCENYPEKVLPHLKAHPRRFLMGVEKKDIETASEHFLS
jgi:hypothetical protein